MRTIWRNFQPISNGGIFSIKRFSFQMFSNNISFQCKCVARFGEKYVLVLTLPFSFLLYWILIALFEFLLLLHPGRCGSTFLSTPTNYKISHSKLFATLSQNLDSIESQSCWVKKWGKINKLVFLFSCNFCKTKNP